MHEPQDAPMTEHDPTEHDPTEHDPTSWKGQLP